MSAQKARASGSPASSKNLRPPRKQGYPSITKKKGASKRSSLQPQSSSLQYRITHKRGASKKAADFNQKFKNMPSTENVTINRNALMSAIRQLCAAHRIPMSEADAVTEALITQEQSHAKEAGSLSNVKKSNIKWPTETFSAARETRGENIVQFLRRVWRSAIEQGATRMDLRDRDPSAEMAVANYIRATRGFPNGRTLPSDIAIPTKKEVNDKLLASGIVPVADAARVAQAVRRRHAKALTPL
jgi:hypothetical protein